MISKEGKEGSGIRRPPQRALGAWATLLVLAVLHLFSGCRNGRQTQALNDANEPWFEEVSKRAGIDLIQHSGRKGKYLFPEISFGGLGLCDFDGDGFLDIYFLQGHPLHEKTAEGDTNQLYRNRGDGTFEDVTTAARVGDSGYGMGCACGDYDNDGDVDLYVTNLGPNVLYENQGDGTFSEVTKAAGVGDSSWGASAAFVDYDQDQDLDLFVVNYVNWLPEHELQCVSTGGLPDYCSPNNYQAHARDTLYRNNGDGTFTDVSRQAGLSTAFGNGFGIAPGDYNGDTLMDFYVANDGMPNQLWINQGDGTFTEEALMSGCAVSRDGIAEAGMGVTGVDIESDGDLDLFMTHLHTETNTFYRNGEFGFEDSTALMGLAEPSLSFTGFGVGFADFDQDGYLDVYVANGRVERHDPTLSAEEPYAEPNQLFVGPASR